MPERLTAVVAGQTVTVKYRNGDQKVTVAAPCTEKHAGRWYCVTHGEHFDNQFMKDCHIHTGTHRLAWICQEHGAEQP